MEKYNIRSISPFNSELKLKGFNAFQIDGDSNATRIYSRKDFYKICLTTGKSLIHYADRSFEMDGTILFFGNPHIPYSWETISRSYVGYTCLFSEDFLQLSDRSESLQQSPLFKIGGTPILKINEAQREFLNTIFRKMIDEQKTEYAYKDELIRNYIHLIIHEALKLQPSENFDKHNNAFSRITSVFLELLERQFPIDGPDNALRLRSANDYAHYLSVHTNHLNRSVKQVTGKTTTHHISSRIVREAEVMLQHTDWDIAEIAYGLGFEDPSYFTNFFKKHTQHSPGGFRQRVV